MCAQTSNCSSITVGNKETNDKWLNHFPEDLTICISNAYLHKQLSLPQTQWILKLNVLYKEQP